MDLIVNSHYGTPMFHKKFQATPDNEETNDASLGTDTNVHMLLQECNDGQIVIVFSRNNVGPMIQLNCFLLKQYRYRDTFAGLLLLEILTKSLLFPKQLIF